MKKRWIGFWTAVSCLAALLAVGLPVVQTLTDAYRRQAQLEQLRQEMAGQTGEQCRLQWNLARWYNHNLGLAVPEENFRKAYGTILTFGDGAMGILEIPQLDWQGMILHGPRSGEIRHRPDSCFPTGGREERTVLELENSKILQELVSGMEVSVLCMDTILRYRVSETPPEQDSLLILTGKGPGGELLTFYCTPGTGMELQRDLSQDVKWALLAAMGMVSLPMLLCCADGAIHRLRRNGRRAPEGEKGARKGFFAFYGCKNERYDV